MHNIRLKQTAQHGAEHFISKQGSLSVAVVLFILYGLLEGGHDIQLFEVQDPQTFHQSGEAICCTFPLAINCGFEKL